MRKVTDNFEKNSLYAAIIMVLIAIVMLIMFVPQVNASDHKGGSDGGKVESWQRTGELPTANLPTTLNLETCTLLSETEWSTTYECDSFVFGTFTVVDPKD